MVKTGANKYYTRNRRDLRLQDRDVLQEKAVGPHAMAHCGDTVEEEMEELVLADADGGTEMAQTDADGEKEIPARTLRVRTRSGREVRRPAHFPTSNWTFKTFTW